MKRRIFLRALAPLGLSALAPINLSADTISENKREIKSAKEQDRIDSPEIKNADHIYLEALSASQGFVEKNNSKRDNMIKLLIAYPLRFRPTNKTLFNDEEKKLHRFEKKEIALDRIDARYNKKTRYVEIFLPNDTEYGEIRNDVLATIYMATVLKALTRNEAKAFKGLIYEQSKNISSFVESIDNKYTNILSNNIKEHENKVIDANEFPSFIEYVEYFRAKAITDSRAVVSTKTMTKEQKLMLTSTYEELTSFKDGKYIADMLNMNCEDEVFSGLVMQKTYQLYCNHYYDNVKISNAMNLLIQTGLEVDIYDNDSVDSETEEKELLPVIALTAEDELAVSEFKLSPVDIHFHNVMVFM